MSPIKDAQTVFSESDVILSRKAPAQSLASGLVPKKEITSNSRTESLIIPRRMIRLISI